MMLKMHKTEASIRMHAGHDYALTYTWVIANDGGDVKLIVLEYSDCGPDELLPDIIWEGDVVDELHARLKVTELLRKSLLALLTNDICYTTEQLHLK